jgi:hypothetical protein
MNVSGMTEREKKTVAFIKGFKYRPEDSMKTVAKRILTNGTARIKNECGRLRPPLSARDYEVMAVVVDRWRNEHIAKPPLTQTIAIGLGMVPGGTRFMGQPIIDALDELANMVDAQKHPSPLETVPPEILEQDILDACGKSITPA